MNGLIDKLAPRSPPCRDELVGSSVKLERIDPSRHGDDLEKHICGETNQTLWDHIPLAPPANQSELLAILAFTAKELGWVSYAICEDETGIAVGTCSLMRIRPEHGSAEIGCVVFSPRLQRTRAATESIFLIGQYLFEELGYRRFEWKCDSRNEASRRAAERFGFQYEGTFRNDMIVKGKNRDTSWFAMTDSDWIELGSSYQQWLSHSNFNQAGKQISSLDSFRQ